MPLFQQLQVRDEGIVQGSVRAMDFVGNVTAVVSGGVATVTIGAPEPTIYTGNGSITDPRIVDLNANVIQFQQGGQYFLVLDPTVNSEVSTLRAFNNTDDGSYSILSASTTDVLSRYLIVADFNDGVNRASIQGSANAASSTLAYTAATHTFTGNVGIGVTPSYLFQVQSAGEDWIRINPADGRSVFQSFNPTDDGNIGGLNARATATAASFEVQANFNDGVKIAAIDASADATTATLEYTADTHTFTGNVGIGLTPSADQLLVVNDGSNNLLTIDKTNFQSDILASDGTAESSLHIQADLVGNSVLFDIYADDGSNGVEIIGDAIAQTITLTAGNGAVMPHIVGGGSAPSIAAGAGAGTGPTVSITGTDIAGYISVTTGTLPTGTNAVIVTVTFNTAFASAPTSIILTPANAITALLGGVTMVFVPQASITTTTFVLDSGTTALTAATAYKWFYQVIQ